MARMKHVYESGVPTGWCVKRAKDKSKFHKKSFRTVCYNDHGGRAKMDTGAVRCITIGCPKTKKWSPKKQRKGYKTKGICEGGTRMQRMMYKPGHYGCSKVKRRKN